MSGRSSISVSILRASLRRPQPPCLGRDLNSRVCHDAIGLLDRDIARTINADLQMRHHVSYRRFSGATMSRASASVGSSSCDNVLDRFRRRAADELVPFTADSTFSGSTPSASQVRVSLQEVAKDELGDTTDCAKEVEQEAEHAVADVTALEELRAERPKLRASRADLLQVSFQSQAAENQEFGALVICATAGIFAVSLHYGFFSIFIVAYWLYRRATQDMRRQQLAVDDLADVIARMKEINGLEAEALAIIRGRASAWRDGRPPVSVSQDESASVSVAKSAE